MVRVEILTKRIQKILDYYIKYFEEEQKNKVIINLSKKSEVAEKYILDSIK